MYYVYSEGVPFGGFNPSGINNLKWGTLNPKKWIGKIRFSSIPSDVEKFSEFDGEVIFHFVVFFLVLLFIYLDEWVSKVIGLPVYLPIRVKVAMGLAETDEPAAFVLWKQQQTKMLRASFGPQEFTPCKGLYTR